MSEPSQEVAIPAQGVIVQPSAAELEWASLTAGDRHYVDSPDLAKDDDLDGLVGVHQFLTSVTYRPGIVRGLGKDKKRFAYVSIESLIGPVQNLRRINRKRKASELDPIENLEDLPFSPLDHVVLNDGSTGIYRQVTGYLIDKGDIIVAGDITPGGEMGESTFDLPPGDWAGHADRDGIIWDYTDPDDYEIVFPVRIELVSGIRRSVYDNPSQPGEKSVTRYL